MALDTLDDTKLQLNTVSSEEPPTKNGGCGEGSNFVDEPTESLTDQPFATTAKWKKPTVRPLQICTEGIGEWDEGEDGLSTLCPSPTSSLGSLLDDDDTVVEEEFEDSDTSTLINDKGSSDEIPIYKRNIYSLWRRTANWKSAPLFLKPSFLEGDERAMRRHVSWASYFAFTRKRHTFILIFGIISAIISAGVLPASSLLLGGIFGEFALFGRGDLPLDELLPRTIVWVKYYLILAGGGWFSYGIFYGSWIWFGELQAESAREVLYTALMAKELEWFDNTEHEILTVANRCHTQIREFQLAVSQPLGLVLQSAVTACACLGVAFYFSWKLTLVCLAGTPIAALAVWFFSNHIERWIDLQSLALGSANQSISRAVKGIDTVKYFSGQEWESNLYKTAIKAAGLAYHRIAFHAALQNGILRFLTLMMFVQGFWYATTLVAPDTPQDEVAGYITTFWACLMAGQQIETVLPLVIFLEKGKVAASNLRRLAAPDVEYDILKREGARPKKCDGFISFDKLSVSFTYPSRRDVASLNSLSMLVKAGETIFIVGKSGCGKSTLANILLTVWKHNSGSIFIDEYPLEKLDRDWIYQNITYVPQRPALFNESVSRNIRFGTKDSDGLTVKDLWRSCEDVFLTDFLAGLPDGLRTILTPGATNFSGGQRQRLSLARARLRDTPIMILDEPTTGLDEATKVLVMNTLREWRKSKTTIIITHNLSDIRPDDWVYVMDAGRVVQGGVRKDLEATHKSPFADLMRDTNTSYESQSPASVRYEESLLDYYMGNNDKENTSGNRGTHLEPASALQSSLSPVNMRRSANRVTFAPDHRTTILSIHPRREFGRNVSQRRKRPRRTRQSMEEIPPTPETKSKMSKDQGLRYIFSTVREHTTGREKTGLAFGIVCCVISAATTPGFSYALARLVESFFTDFTGDRAEFWAFVIMGIAAADSITASLQIYFLEYVGQRWIDSVRAKAYRLVMSQARSWFDVDKNQISRIAQDLEHHAEEMRNLLGRYMGFAINALVILAVGVGWSFAEDLELTAVGLAAAPALVLVLRLFTWVSERYEERGNEEAEKLGVFLQDVLVNLVTVRVLSLKDYFDHKHKKLLRSALSAGRKRAFFTGLTVGSSDSVVSLATALLFWYGARLIVNKGLQMEHTLTVFAMLLFSLSNSAAILRIIPQVSSSKDSARRVLRLLELKDICHENQGCRKVELDGSLIVRDVSFSYPSRRTMVLKNVSLQINPGEFIAIVGASGSGKSTLVALMERLYAPTSGDMIYSGYQSADLCIVELRRQIAIVPQNPYLFPASVKENILYGIDRTSGGGADSVPPLQQIINAAKGAGLTEWIDSLPDGYDTLLAMGDESLSGGQLQKIAIARALVRKPKVLILDECTNGLDLPSANTVMSTLWGLRHSGGWGKLGTTVIMVTHKPDMMRIADRIVVMDGGKIVDQGDMHNWLPGVKALSGC
ncbi:hypothetical protein H072_3819 [Dactylellina haptotyla CBS 200.50]|uniref:Uncharacterized protein n=1 Tax=Dactylellina haptotyla (strain CBS 200.50) TaxID=1284197 RepID=S8C325_DACHA|nr:hypothetical protein H072_3819 [Dactylellina haptotyla CBS 200.50]